MILQSSILLFLFSVASALGADPQGMPECRRPNNFANPGTLKSFEMCELKQKTFCSKNEKLSACDKFNKKPVIKNSDQELAENCSINSSGIYRCKPKPLKLTEKESPGISSPIKMDDTPPAPQGSPTPLPSMPPGVSDPGGSMAIPPPPPAVINPPPGK